MKILDVVEPYSKSQLSISNGIFEYDNLETILHLLRQSLGPKMMDTYLVNQDLTVFKKPKLSRLLLHTDFKYLLREPVLVFSGDQDLIVSDLLK